MAAAETNPLSNQLRLEVAMAQRNYLALKQQTDQALEVIRSKVEQAEKVCAEAGQSFDAQSITCVPKKK